MNKKVNEYLVELLHINELYSNKLIDLSCDRGQTFYITKNGRPDMANYMLGTIASRLGKVANIALHGSQRSASAGASTSTNNSVNFVDNSGNVDAAQLHKFIDNAMEDIKLKGNNPVFLSVGELVWEVPAGSGASAEIRTVRSPLMIFPVRLVRQLDVQPIYIEFIDDEAYFNACLYYKLAEVYPGMAFEHQLIPEGSTISLPIDIGHINYAEITARVKDMADKVCNEMGGNVRFESNTVAISTYKHDEMCMYNDLKRHESLLDSHANVQFIFEGSAVPVVKTDVLPQMVLPYDSNQEAITKAVLSGENIIIKGPPGTGKTLTIANIISNLLWQNKRVLMVSEKLSALAEVHDKVPECLQKYLLLLTSESESQAGKVGVPTILRSLKDAANGKLASASVRTLQQDKQYQDTKKRDIMMRLSNYYSAMFGESEGYLSLYDALCILCKYPDAPLLDCVSPDRLFEINYSDIMAIKDTIDNLDPYINKMMEGCDGILDMCPWFLYDVDNFADTREAMKNAKNIRSGLITKIELLAEYPILDSLTAKNLLRLGKISLAEVLLRSLSECTDLQKLRADLDMVIGLFKNANLDKLSEIDCAKLEDIVLPSRQFMDDIGMLTVSDVFSMQQDAELLSRTASVFDNSTTDSKLRRALDKYGKCKASMAASLDSCRLVFAPDVLQDANNAKIIVRAYNDLQKYISGEQSKITALDLKAKSSYSKIMKLTVDNSATTFAVLLVALKHAYEYVEARQGEQDSLNAVSELLVSKINNQQADNLLAIYTRIGNRGSVSKAQRQVLPAVKLLAGILPAFPSHSVDNLTIAELLDILPVAQQYNSIAGHFAEVMGVSVEQTMVNAGNIVDMVHGVDTIVYLMQCSKMQGVELPINRILATIASIDMVAPVNNLVEFSQKYFVSSRYADLNKFTLAQMRHWCKYIASGDVQTSVVTLVKEISHSSYKQLLIDFYVEAGSLPRVDISHSDLFERAYYNKSVQCSLYVNQDKLPAAMTLKALMHDYAEADLKSFGYNALVLEKKCRDSMPREVVNAGFLSADRSGYSVSRVLFAKTAKEIVHLKKCMIMSPSTVSILLRDPQFFNFDTVIVDEASQVPVAHLLPAIIRAKQFVLVGDEMQMPPIRHFETTRDVDDGGIIPIKSALDIIRVNDNLNVCQLQSHYRSNTESLIAFSQKKFYPNMHTFPAVVPRAEGIGIVDILVEDAVVDKGQNILEAEKIVELVDAHYTKYFDSSTNTLSQSVGVVVFGESQAKRIVQLLESTKNKQLSSKISLTRDKFFICTIEKVQGQETDHLIISMTYGKRANGNMYLNFGMLNHGEGSNSNGEELGRRIFNVAVTRGKSSVTVVHSFRPEDIPMGSSLEYIREYLELSSYYASGDAGHAFVSEPTDNAFIMDVRNSLLAMGIADNRIVVNYGMTSSSYRIPIAILSHDLSRAELGIMCELSVKGSEYIDNNIRVKGVLAQRGWTLHDIYIGSWVLNKEDELNALKEQLRKLNIITGGC